MTWLTGLFLYLALVNTAGLVVMGIDKKKAVRGQWRIPEKTFFLLSIAGGSAGTLAGMYLFRHKTLHWYFVVFIPVILAAQLIAALLVTVL